MHFYCRILVLLNVAASISVVSPLLHAQAGKGSRKLMLGQFVLLTGAADQIGLAYFNGAKMYFDAINAKNGVAGYKIEVKTLDGGYNATRASANAKLLIDEGADALFGFASYAGCDAPSAVTKSSGIPFFLHPLPTLMRCETPLLATFFMSDLVLPMKPTKWCAAAPLRLAQPGSNRRICLRGLYGSRWSGSRRAGIDGP